MDNLFDQLRRDESVRSKPYLDCCGKYWRECTCAVKGKLTIGVGRNLDDVGLFPEEIDILERNDIQRVTNDLIQLVPWTRQLDTVRAAILQNMCFNMGIAGLLNFRHMLEALKAGNFGAAANEMENSAWYHQVGDRAKRLVNQMISGAWQ